jgi:hypothetical protein
MLLKAFSSFNPAIYSIALSFLVVKSISGCFNKDTKVNYNSASGSALAVTALRLW